MPKDNKQTLISITIPLIIVTCFFASFFMQPALLTGINNDLVFFKPMYGYIFKYVTDLHFLPLWQNRILSGSPLLGDPQNPLLYLPFYLGLILSPDSFFLVLFWLQYCVAALSMWYLARTYHLSAIASIAAGVVYALSPKFAAHLSAGHINMLAAYAFAPAYLAGVLQLKNRPSRKTICITALCGAYIFLNYLTVFIYVLIAGIAVFFYNGSRKNFTAEKIFSYAAAIGLFLIIILPQLEVGTIVGPVTTRNLLNIEDLGPRILSLRRFIHSVVSPYTYGLSQLETETVLTFGMIPFLLSGAGFITLKRRSQVVIAAISAVILIFALGPKTIIYAKLLFFLPQLLLFRITTRCWFLLVIIVALLCGKSLEQLRNKYLQMTILFTVTAELFIFSQMYIRTVDNSIVSTSPIQEITGSLTWETGYYRLYCPTNCLLVDLYENKGIADGYNPTQLRSYYDFFQMAAGYRFASYAVGLPPFQTRVDNPQPDSEKMGILGVRYTVSPYKITTSGWRLVRESPLYVYKNLNESPRVYLTNAGNKIPLIPHLDLPGKITIALDKNQGDLIFNEVYLPFWKAYDEQGKPFEILPEQNIIMRIAVDRPVQTVTVEFHPPLVYPLIFLSLTVSAILIFSIILI